MKPKKEAVPMLSIGAASQATLAEARKAIVEILRTPNVDNNTKVEALKALDRLCSVTTSVNGCNFTNG